ncbi:hypothetical protein JDV02_003349 [Purpureocillium takamizusanense]|uniref:NAD(P)-binding domain-containing protein n=1 Tax=Purpureocillium takamizusanense TaxID=2060973 RepID=A0A9Q8V8R8_9HYPO|nr:uncharacterized protein JDV02_003349 [Purpureocillium takamizusanense]UNI16968.1 hypothetical protein JDV02_003349 [Purpureocillium takamizusanense]
MKLVIAGSTGFVATELIRQAISHDRVTSVVALGRRETAVPPNVVPGGDASKLKSVVCSDFEKYSADVKKELAGADACIWTIGVTPSHLKTMPFEQATKISRDYALACAETMAGLPRGAAGTPLRFIYMSGSGAVRDPAKKPWILGDYCVMRGNAESRVLDLAKQSNGSVETGIAKPGLIDAPGKMGVATKFAVGIGRAFIGLPLIDVRVLSAALLDQAVNGLDKDTLLNEDMERIGQRVLEGDTANKA